jgi:hypothetical protein
MARRKASMRLIKTKQISIHGRTVIAKCYSPGHSWFITKQPTVRSTQNVLDGAMDAYSVDFVSYVIPMVDLQLARERVQHELLRNTNTKS